MIRAGVAALVSVASLAVADAARACTPIRYDVTGISPASMAAEMVRDAASIEIMRVSGRRAVPKPDPLYLRYYEPPYFYQLESVATLYGEPLGSLEVAGFEDGWLERVLGPSPLARRLTRSEESLWWTTPEGYAELQSSAVLDPGSQSSIACESPLAFTVGVELLVFRTRRGELLEPGLTGTFRYRGSQRPAMERLHGEDDPWLLEVRQAIASAPPRTSPSPSWFDWLFAAVYGSGFTPVKTH